MFTATFYVAPFKMGAWRQRSKYWRRGFVLRLGWFGFAVRWGKIYYDLPSSCWIFTDEVGL